MKNQLFAIAALIPMLSTPTLAQRFNITSLSQTGRLTWTNAFTNGVYSVQWAPDATADDTQWRETWDYLKSLVGTSNTVTANVPMVYRVRCVTNLFVPMPLGRTLKFLNSDASGNIWTLTSTCLSILHVPTMTNDYVLQTLMPGPMYLRRSTDNARYQLDTYNSTEHMMETYGSVGTTWSWTDMYGNTNTATIISTNLAVTVAAGTFSNCLYISNRWNTGCYWLDYVKPGLGPVKQVDFCQPNPPVVSQLQAVTDQ